MLSTDLATFKLGNSANKLLNSTPNELPCTYNCRMVENCMEEALFILEIHSI